MDNNKLYNALLKTQERHRAERAAHSRHEEAEDVTPHTGAPDEHGKEPSAELTYLRRQESEEKARAEKRYARKSKKQKSGVVKQRRDTDRTKGSVCA